MKSNFQRALETLEQVVNINSGTKNFAGVNKVGDVFSDISESLGYNLIDAVNPRNAGAADITSLVKNTQKRRF